jgi:hypothetical protein
MSRQIVEISLSGGQWVSVEAMKDGLRLAYNGLSMLSLDVHDVTSEVIKLEAERDAYKGFYEWWVSNRESDIDEFIEEAPLMAGPEDLAACVKALKAIREVTP